MLNFTKFFVMTSVFMGASGMKPHAADELSADEATQQSGFLSRRVMKQVEDESFVAASMLQTQTKVQQLQAQLAALEQVTEETRAKLSAAQETENKAVHDATTELLQEVGNLVAPCQGEMQQACAKFTGQAIQQPGKPETACQC